MLDIEGISVVENDSPRSISEIFELISLVEKKLKRIQRHTIQEANLTPSQYFVLSLLWEHDERPLNELATIFCASRPTITSIVDTLENKALVSRIPNPADRRSLLVKLTIDGKALQDSTPTLDHIFRGCCTGLTQDDFRLLGQLLHKLNHSLSLESELSK
jgi:DNA-binding MarR family transcriptional regulator